MGVGRKLTHPRNVKYSIFPDWNPYKRSRNISFCALAWSTILLLALLTGVMIMTLRKNSYLYGRCRLNAFSDECHICYVSPFAEGGKCEKYSKDTCHFVVLAVSEQGRAYKGPYEAEYQLEPWTKNDTLAPTNPAFRCCPEDYNCCDWMDEETLTFCDTKCKAGRPHGWPCRFRVEGNDTATDVEYREYWRDEEAIRHGQAAVLAAFIAVALVLKDPCSLRGRRLSGRGAEGKPGAAKRGGPEASPKAKAAFPAEDEFSKYSWTPRTAANATRGLLSPLRRAPGGREPRGRSVPPEPVIEAVAPESSRGGTPPRDADGRWVDGIPVTAFRTYAERRIARRARSAPGASRAGRVPPAADGQSALARADWAAANREVRDARLAAAGRPVPPPVGRRSLEAWA